MATIDYKEKYDEALKVAESIHRFSSDPAEIKRMEQIFPELKESDGDKIRKALLEMIHDTTGDSLWVDYNVHKEDALAWLEKQGEQKPVWSEADDNTLLDTINILRSCGRCSTDRKLWLMSLKNRCQPQPKQKWSEEDEKKIVAINEAVEYYWSDDAQAIVEIQTWLKSIRPQNTWKPSEGQLECLGYAIEKAEKDWSPLINNRIYLTLKALKKQLEKL